MSDLESRAAAHLKPMIRGETTVLDPKAAGLVALWASKTAMTWQFVERPENRVIPGEHLKALYESRRPPEGSLVWLGATDWGEGVWKRTVGIDHSVQSPIRGDYGRAYATTIQLAYLVLLIFGSALRVRRPIEVHGNLAEALVPIWPGVEEILRWPPAVRLSRTHVPILADMFAASAS